MQEDYAIMRSVFEDVHPGLYWYASKKEMDRTFNRAYRSLNAPLTEQEFINKLQPVIYKIRCGHTGLEPSMAFRKSPNRPKTPHLPVDVFISNEQAWIVKTQTGREELLGAELLSVNDIPVKRIIKKAIQSMSSDGSNITWKEFFLNEYDFFEDICWKNFNLNYPYVLKIKNKDGKVSKHFVSGEKVNKPSANVADQNKPDNDEAELTRGKKYLNLNFLKDSITALMTVNGLEYGDEEYYKKFFKEIFEKDTKNLILDIRKNHGGDLRIITHLLSYLADEDYKLLEVILAKKPNPNNTHYSSYLDPEIKRGHEFGFKPGIKDGKWYSLEATPEMGNITGIYQKAAQYGFKGNLYVLIGGGTFSNASNFSAALKTYRKNVIFVGAETGGTESGCGGGTNQKLTLPNSGIVVNLPLMRLVSVAKNKNRKHGLLPDIEVIETPETIIDKRDAVLEKAVGLCTN